MLTQLRFFWVMRCTPLQHHATLAHCIGLVCLSYKNSAHAHDNFLLMFNTVIGKLQIPCRWYPRYKGTGRSEFKQPNNKKYKDKSLPLILLQLSLLISRYILPQLTLGILCHKWQRKQHVWYRLQWQRYLLSSPLSMVTLRSVKWFLPELQPV